MTKTRDLSDFLIEGGADLPLGKPHIVPDVLYPAVGGNDINGTDIDTSHGSTYTYGELHTDGRKYYYTDIKGSKPIKDPRIGGHFGSQRHKFKSLQLLEQETATEGKNVYSVDGREWVRAVQEDTLVINNDSQGNYIALKDEDYVEIVGYFNDANFATYTYSGSVFGYKIDGGSFTSFSGSGTSVNTPLGSRYVDAASFLNLSLSVSLGIHTLRIKYDATGTSKIYAIELITQDTSNRNNIQIPSQNVVSFGKKFNVSGTPHYDPFNGFTSGSSVSSYVDTATSLGVEKWKNSSTYYRPYNGGRVVKWVDSSGVIKTSVTLMPPNAKSIGNSSSLTNATAKANASASNDTFYPTFEAHTTDVNEDNLHEIAKTFHWREFGNGSANGSGGYNDASMLSTTTIDIAYVMDDGLTSLSADDAGDTVTLTDFSLAGNGDLSYLTFIGTGISITGNNSNLLNDTKHIAQNLPYGTHIFKNTRGASATGGDYIIDGVDTTVGYGWGGFREVTFYQPKRPPIPEDACVIADYMLMADFVAQNANGLEKISKGTRLVSCSRDVFFDAGGSFTFQQARPDQQTGFKFFNANGTSQTKLPFFGTGIVHKHESNTSDGMTLGFTNNGTNFSGGTFFGEASSNQLVQTSASSGGIFGGIHSLELGTYTPKFLGTGQSGKNYRGSAYEVISPIHTSHHYQSFETPFLHELVGGDRNMEQTNLVVSPDGKTWDEVTRDTSYIGNGVLAVSKTDGDVTTNQTWKFTETRGNSVAGLHQYNKNWALAYDTFICLVDGNYNFVFHIRGRNAGGTVYCEIELNGLRVQRGSGDADGTAYRPNVSLNVNLQCQRGDLVNVTYDDGEGQESVDNQFNITKL